MSRPTAQALIECFQLLPHPEGCYYRETYRDTGTIPRDVLPGRFAGPRSYSTAIYYLIPAGKRSGLHRISADEVWHFYLGDPLQLEVIHPDGRLEQVILGPNITKGERVQFIVPAGCWFGGQLIGSGEYAFGGCTVAPGFDFADFALADRAILLRQFPQHRAMIERLT